MKHGKVEKKADQVVKKMKKKNTVILHPQYTSTIDTFQIASKDDEKEKEKDKKSMQNKQRRMTTVRENTV